MSLVISKNRKGRILPGIVDDFFSMSSFFESSLLDFNSGFLSEHNFPLVPDAAILKNETANQMQLAESESAHDLNAEIKNDELIDVEEKVGKRKS